jgi:hypothetical protein
MTPIEISVPIGSAADVVEAALPQGQAVVPQTPAPEDDGLVGFVNAADFPLLNVVDPALFAPGAEGVFVIEEEEGGEEEEEPAMEILDWFLQQPE